MKFPLRAWKSTLIFMNMDEILGARTKQVIYHKGNSIRHMLLEIYGNRSAWLSYY